VTLLALAVSGRGVVDPEVPAVFADDEGFLRGRGAFETTRVYGSRPFRLRDHLDRLEASAQRLGVQALPQAQVEALVAEALAAAGADEAFVRIYLTPGREGAGEPVALALVGSLPPDLEQVRARGIGLISVSLGLEGPPLLGGVKSTSYAANMVAMDEARRRGADDAVFLARGGLVLEGPTTNIWWRQDQTLFTPALELGVLAGVTRAVLLETAPVLGYDVREGVFGVSELAVADEAFTSSSIREVMPVIALDGEPIPRGEAAAKLQAALRAAAYDSTGRR
jgi:branched-subunit amino acid aminotransferase/4-amino-4-deoxychorismate lyase